MSKQEFIDLIKKLIINKIEYNRVLGKKEVIIDEMITDVYNDLMEYMYEEMDKYFVDYNENDLLNFLITEGSNTNE